MAFLAFFETNCVTFKNVRLENLIFFLTRSKTKPKIVTDNVRLTHEVDELKRKLLAFEQSESK